MIELERAAFGYGSEAILRDVTLTVPAGSMTAVMGPNGAGKTTLFRGMLGLIPARGGRIAYGFDRRAHPPGYVPQRDTLDPIFPLSALEVVEMAAAARLSPLRRAGSRIRRLARDSLERVGMDAFADHPFWRLSGGQKQRVLIARALAVEPRIVLLDEPTAGVDAAAEASILQVLETLHAEAALTVLLVSHHVAVVRRLVDTIVWVEDGRVSVGPAAAMLERASS